METVLVDVILVEKQIDWMTGKRKESKIQIKVDSDKAEATRGMKLLDMRNTPRNSNLHTKIASLVLYAVGSTYMQSGDRSIGSYLYGVKPKTHRKKNCSPFEFTREAYGLA